MCNFSFLYDDEQKEENISKIQNQELTILSTTKLKQDLIVENNDIIFQITTTENQKNNNYSNISNIDLGECEDRL